jgi:hypothetical protein
MSCSGNNHITSKNIGDENYDDDDDEDDNDD